MSLQERDGQIAKRHSWTHTTVNRGQSQKSSLSILARKETCGMTSNKFSALFIFLSIGSVAVPAIGLSGMSPQSENTPTFAAEAPTGFKTPTLQHHPGSRSVSNGIP